MLSLLKGLLNCLYNKDMKKKNITIDDLARMVLKGFDEMQRELMKTAKKKDVDERFDRIEKLILADYKRRIGKLEEEVKELRSLLAVG